jgi:hypothetical protein
MLLNDILHFERFISEQTAEIEMDPIAYEVKQTIEYLKSENLEEIIQYLGLLQASGGSIDDQANVEQVVKINPPMAKFKYINLRNLPNLMEK